MEGNPEITDLRARRLAATQRLASMSILRCDEQGNPIEADVLPFKSPRIDSLPPEEVA